MAELEEKLNAILSDPEAMGQIMNIAKALTGSDGAAAPATPAAPPLEAEFVPVSEQTSASSEEAAADTPSQPPDLSALLGLLSGQGGGDLDPRLLSVALRLLSEYHASDDRKIALLTALQPFLKEERYAKVDKAIQITKLARVIRVAFQLLKKEGNADV